MPRSAQAVTEAELMVMKLLWDRGQLTARQIRETLYPAGTNSDHGTVQKLLQRLEEKGFVYRDRATHAHVFEARISRDQFAGQQFELLAEKLTEGSMVPFLMHLVKKRISPEEREAIMNLLNDWPAD